MMALRLLSLLAAAAVVVAGCQQSSYDTPEQLVSMGRFDEAVEASTQRLRTDPRDASAYLYRGRAYHCRNQSGDLERAISDFTAAIELAPQDPEAYYSRALAHRDAGKTEDSEADQRAARERDPRLKEAYAAVPESMLPAADEEEVSEPSTRQENQSAKESPEHGNAAAEGASIRGDRRRGRQVSAGVPSDGGVSGLDELPPVAPAGKTREEIWKEWRARQKAELADDSVLTDQVDPLGPAQGKPSAGRTVAGDEPRLERPLPASPWAQRAPVPADPQPPRNSVQTPFGNASASPFPQLAPRPTGRVEQPLPEPPARRQARPLYSNPYAPPKVQPAAPLRN